MMMKPEIGVILSPLEKRFRALNGEQRDVYYDRLKYFQKPILEAAVSVLVDYAKSFPAPGEIIEKARQAQKDRPDLMAHKVRGCPSCHGGYVFYERMKNSGYVMYVANCAHCYKGEVSTVPQLIQRDDCIYYGCEAFNADGQKRYRAHPSIEELFNDAQPIQTSKQLKEYFNSKTTGEINERMGAERRQELIRKANLKSLRVTRPGVESK